MSAILRVLFSNKVRAPFPIRRFTTKPLDRKILYLVADRRSVKSDQEYESKIESLKNYTRYVQLRDPDNALKIDTACRLKEILNKNGTRVVTTDLNLALAIKANGVYLEQNHTTYEQVRALLGKEASIGMPAETVTGVLAEEHRSHFYWSVKVFPSKQTNPEGSQARGIEWLKKVRSLSRHPIVAIGGMNLSNIESVYQEMHLESDCIALAGILMRAKNPPQVAEEIYSIFQKVRTSKEAK
jgi:thiamine-phosphate pyrophosphorylase